MINISTTFGAGRSVPPSSSQPPHPYQAQGGSYTYRKLPQEQTPHGSGQFGASPYNPLPHRAQHPRPVPEHPSSYGAHPWLNTPSALQTNSNVFRFSGTEETIMNSSVTDQWGRLVLVLSSTKYETNIVNGENQIVAILDWTLPYPVIDFHGQEVKVWEWLACADGNTTLTHKGRLYDWTESDDKGTCELFPRGGSGRPVAKWRKDEEKQIVVEVSQEALQEEDMCDACLICAFLMNCGKTFNGVHESETGSGAIGLA